MDRLLENLVSLGLLPWAADLRIAIDRKRPIISGLDAKAKRYSELLAHLPEAIPSHFDLDASAVTIGAAVDLDPGEKEQLLAILQGLSPWRKGPFKLFGIDIDSEWVSALKWTRLAGRISSLQGRRVLDIGCSSGYYMFRMAEANPTMVLGLEPYLTYYFQ